MNFDCFLIEGLALQCWNCEYNPTDTGYNDDAYSSIGCQAYGPHESHISENYARPKGYSVTACEDTYAVCVRKTMSKYDVKSLNFRLLKLIVHIRLLLENL